MVSVFRVFRRGGGRAYYMAGPRATTVLGKTVAEMYREQPALRAVVSFLANNVGSLPLKVYERRGENDRPRDRSSALSVLIDHPSDGVTTHELVRDSVADVLLYGWSLWYVIPSADTESGWEVTRIPPSWVQDTYTDDGWEPSAYVVQVPEAGRAPVRIDASDTVRFALYDPSDPVSPASPVESLKQVLAEQVSAWDYRNQVWRNGGRISRWISRPQGADWSPQAKGRFAKSWKERFSGEDGDDTGGTPILEDGMQLHDTQLNAKEAEWSEATKLAREDVAAAYGVNPSIIWHTDTQTYASAKDNARALYSETLAPYIDLFEERINKVLAPKLGVTGRYVQFDVQTKLQAAPEELIPTLTSAVGRPILTANEARSIINRPALPGDADELVTPMNVIAGNINGEQNDGGFNAAQPRAKSEGPCLKSHQRADAGGSAQLTKTLAKFFERQSKRVLPEIDKAKAKDALSKADGDGHYAKWWDARRWDRELADDIEPTMRGLVAKSGRQTLRDIRIDAEFDGKRTEAYVRKMAEGRARAINNATYRQLRHALELDEDEAYPDVAADTPKGVFDKARESRAPVAAVTVAAACAVFGMREAIGQRAPASEYRRMKTWRHDGAGEANPRSDHMAMDGETVPYDERFSNGMMWPHDDSFDPDDIYGCQCSVEISVYRI